MNDLIEAGKINQYLVSAVYWRTTRASGDMFPYNSVSKSVNFYGYKSADPDNDDLPELDTGYSFTEYSDYRGANYFNSYSSQIADAYNAYRTLH